MLLWSLIFFFLYCLIVCGIAFEAWKAKACGDMLIWFFFIAIVAGFIAELVVIGNIPSPNGVKTVYRDVGPVVTYDCTDSTMSNARQQAMANFIDQCKHSETFGYCSDHARQLFCRPVMKIEPPVSKEKKDSL